MRALFLVHNLPERGSYFRALEIARRVAARSHFVQFAYVGNSRKYRPIYNCYRDPGRNRAGTAGQHEHEHEKQRDARSKIVFAEMPYFTFFNDRQEGWSVFDNAIRARDALASKWDLVYGFSHKPDCVLPGLAAKLRGAKLILDWSDWWGGPEGLYRQCVIPSNAFQSMPRPFRYARGAVFALEEMWEPWVYRAADAVTLISEEFYRHPRAPRGLAEKSLVFHSGAPLDQIQTMEKQAARERIGLGVPTGSTVLGYVANFHMDERLVMEAFAQVCRANAEVHLLVVGADFETTTPEIHAATRDRIHHFGRQPFERVGEFLGASDILLMPLTDIALDRARYPHKLSDYVAAGRPIVACDVGETGRLLKRYGIGSLCQPKAASFAESILELSSQRHDWTALGIETRAAATQHFVWDRICQKLFDFLSARTGIDI
jgi:glycosyltransferase involved in cell wall biosynthesis